MDFLFLPNQALALVIPATDSYVPWGFRLELLIDDDDGIPIEDLIAYLMLIGIPFDDDGDILKVFPADDLTHPPLVPPPPPPYLHAAPAASCPHQ